MTAPDPDAAVPEPSRRSVVRGIALLGLAGAAGVPLGGCGGGGSDAVSADGPPLPEAQAPAQLPTKSQVYRRTPEPRTRTATTAKAEGTQTTTRTRPATTAKAAQAPQPSAVPLPEPVVPRDPAVGTKPAGGQTAARKPQAAAESRGAAKPARQQSTAGSAPATAASKPSDDLSQAKTSDIPVGGGRIYPKEKVVVTQPKEGEFKGFSASCTHQGCLVSEVRAGDGIICFCHGSKFGIADGSVLKGPALLPLPAEKITVEGDRIVHGGHGVGPASRHRRAR